MHGLQISYHCTQQIKYLAVHFLYQRFCITFNLLHGARLQIKYILQLCHLVNNSFGQIQIAKIYNKSACSLTYAEVDLLHVRTDTPQSNSEGNRGRNMGIR